MVNCSNRFGALVNSGLLLADWRSIKKNIFYMEFQIERRGHEVPQQATAAIKTNSGQDSRTQVLESKVFVHGEQIKCHRRSHVNRAS